MIKNDKIQKLAIVVALFALTACGVKPNMVDPPAGVTVDTFPQTYPPADAGTHPPGRYLPPGYQPQAPKDDAPKSDPHYAPADTGHAAP